MANATLGYQEDLEVISSLENWTIFDAM